MTRAKDQYRDVSFRPKNVELSALEIRRAAAEVADLDPKKRIPELDLHGEKRPELLEPRVRDFISVQTKQGKNICRIVHGIGGRHLEKGICDVLKAMKDRGEVVDFFDSTQYAAMVVMLNEEVLE